MTNYSPQEVWFRELMEADEIVRPLILAEWCRDDPWLGGQIRKLWAEFEESRLLQDTESSR